MDIGELVTHFGADMKEMERALARSKALLKDYETNTTTAGKTTEKSYKKMGASVSNFTKTFLGVAVAGAAVGMAVRKVFQDSVQFQTKFAEVRTLIDETKYSAKGLQQGMEGLSGAYGDMTQKAGALYQAISAGVEASKSVEFLGEAAKFSKAGVTDLLSSVDLLTTAINSYGMESTQVGWVSDIMFETIKRGKTTAEELAGSFGRVLATAAAVGVTFEELNAAVAALTASGIQTTETMSGLKQVFANIAKPQGKAIETAQSLGIEFNVAALKAKGFAGFLKDLVTATEGNTQAQVNLFGSVEAFNSMAVLASEAGSKRFTDALEGMGSAAGNTFTALEKFSGTWGYEWERTWNNATKSLMGFSSVFGQFLRIFNDGTEAQEAYYAARARNEGKNAQTEAVGNWGFDLWGQKKEFIDNYDAVKQLNKEMAADFNRDVYSMTGMVSVYGERVEELVAWQKKWGISTTDAMARLVDYTVSLREEKDLIDLITNSTNSLEDISKVYGDDIIRLAAEHKRYTNEALDPLLQKLLAVAVAAKAAKNAIHTLAPTDYTGKLSGEFQQAWETAQDKKDLMKLLRPEGDKLPAGYVLPSTLAEDTGYANKWHLGGQISDQSGLAEDIWSQKLPEETFVFPTPDETGITAWGEVLDGLTNKFDLLGTAVAGMGEAWRMAISGQASFAEAFKRMALSVISSLSQMAIVEAATNFAKGVAAAANPLTAYQAPGYFSAAMAWGAVAAASGAASIAMSRGGSRGSGEALGPQGTAFNPVYTQESSLVIELSKAIQTIQGIPPGQVVTIGMAQAGGAVAVMGNAGVSELAQEITGSVYK